MMKKIFFTLLIVSCYSAAFCQNDDKANVLNLERTVADALSKHNVPALNNAIADDATIVSATGAVITKQQLFQAMQNVNGVSVSDMKVRVEGYVAIVTGIETEQGVDSHGTAYVNKMYFTDVLTRDKSQKWTIISSQATLIPQ